MISLQGNGKFKLSIMAMNVRDWKMVWFRMPYEFRATLCSGLWNIFAFSVWFLASFSSATIQKLKQLDNFGAFQVWICLVFRSQLYYKLLSLLQGSTWDCRGSNDCGRSSHGQRSSLPSENIKLIILLVIHKTNFGSKFGLDTCVPTFGCDFCILVCTVN